MNLTDIFWPDSDLEQISILYNVAELTVWNSNTNRRLIIQCSGLAGITDLCIWDDQIIIDVDLLCLSGTDLLKSQDSFLQKLCAAYPYSTVWDEKKLDDGIMILKFLLANNIWFNVYCQNIGVIVHENQNKATC